jgi:hypothetical protein
MALNCPHFDFLSCNFSAANMQDADKDAKEAIPEVEAGASDGKLPGKEGSGRVALHHRLGLSNCYTLECHYSSGTAHPLPPLPGDSQEEKAEAEGPTPSQPYSIADFEAMGQAIAVSLLDLEGANPHSRLPASEHRTLGGLLQWSKEVGLHSPS